MATVHKTIHIEGPVSLGELMAQLTKVLNKHGKEAVKWPVIISSAPAPTGAETFLPFSPPNVPEIGEGDGLGFKRTRK